MWQQWLNFDRVRIDQAENEINEFVKEANRKVQTAKPKFVGRLRRS